MLNRIKRINSHVGYARFLAQCEPTIDDTAAIIGVIPRQLDIPSPYAYSQFWSVYRYQGQPVIVRETAHKRYDVFAVPADMVRAEYAESTTRDLCEHCNRWRMEHPLNASGTALKCPHE